MTWLVLWTTEHKLIVDRLTGTYFLYDLVSDPGEKINLVDSEPELFEAMPMD